MDRNRIVRAFLFEVTTPGVFLLSVNYRKKSEKEIYKTIKGMVREGCVKEVDRSTKRIMYRYYPESDKQQVE